MFRILSIASSLLGMAAFAATVPAQQPGFARIFDDHMVLQRGEPVPVWGWGEAGAAVVVRFGDQQKRAEVGADGRWQVTLDALKASADGRAMALTVGDARFELEDVLVGEVWVCGGQSNMAGYSGGLAGAEPPIDAVHLFGNDGIWKRASEPMDDGTDQVDLVSAEAPGHSLMLSFAKTWKAATGLPVGIIPAPLGGTNLVFQWQRDANDPDNRGTLYGSQLHRVRCDALARPATTGSSRVPQPLARRAARRSQSARAHQWTTAVTSFAWPCSSLRL